MTLNLMMKLNKQLQAAAKDERGQDMVEYAIMTGMIAVAAIVSITAIGTWVATQFSTLKTALGA